MASRLLRQSEIDFARQVFEDQLPYNKVHLASYFLPGNKDVAVTLASVSSLIPVRSMRNYTIYFGPEVFSGGADQPRFADTLIHELTHVWQGYHGGLGWEYMIESMIAQGHAVITQGDRGKAYDDKPGAAWGSYNVEQQAHIVQDWFSNGMKADDERYTYVANNIRAGRN